MSSFANRTERNLNDSNVFNNSYQSPFPQKSPLPLQSKSKGQFSSFGRDNPPQFNESINYGSPLMDQQQHPKIYMNSDSNQSLFKKNIGSKSFSSKLLKGISQVPGGQNSGARFNVNQETDSSFAHQEGQANMSSLRINKYKSQGSIQLPEISPPSQFENNNPHPNVQLLTIQKSNFGINHGMLNSHELSTDRSHRRMVSLPSDQAIANILSGSFNVHHHHQPSSVGQTYQNLNEISKEKIHHKHMKPLPTEQLIGLPIYQAQNSARVNGYENDIDYLKSLMAQGSASTDTTPKHEFRKASLDEEKKKKKKRKEKETEKEKKPKTRPASPPKVEEPMKKKPVNKERKMKKVVIRENNRQLERELEQARIERIRGKMRTWLWIMAFPRLLRNRIMEYVDEKRLDVNKSAKQDIKDIVNLVSNFIKKNCFTYLQLLYDKKQSLNIVPYDKKSKKDLNKKSIEQRSKLISTSLLSILTSVMNATINHEMPMEIIEFFASITENLNIVPTGFLFPFEINRLEFTHFLTLKNMNPMRSKMMIAMFFLIRMLVYYFLTQPWNAKVKVTETPLLLENLKICSSVLYHVIFNFFRKRLPIVKGHKDSQESEKKLKPRNGLLFCFGESERPDGPVTEDEVIIGLFSRAALNDYFLLEKGAVEEMNDIIEQWLDIVYTKVQVHQVCLQKPTGKQKAIFA